MQLALASPTLLHAASAAAEPLERTADKADGAPLQAPSDEVTHPEDAEIVVTGTLIRGIAPAGANVLGISRDYIEASGAASTAQLLQTIPQLGSFNTLQVPAGLGNSITSNRPNLRRLQGELAGGATTLILLDGVRVVGMGVQSTSPDPDIVPPGMIERIEVLPDGGSSLYGSDAIGGVMNFITRKRFDGLDVDARYGFADDYYRFDANATLGRDWGSGSVFLSYNYAKHDALFGRDRDFVRQFPATVNGVPFPVTGLSCSPGNVQLGNGTVHALPYTAGTARPNTANQCDTSDDVAFYPREQRHSLMAGLSQELSDAIRLDLRAFYTKRDVYLALGPFRGSQFIGSAALGLTPSPFQQSYKLTPAPVEVHQVSFAFAGGDALNSDVRLETWGIAPTVTADLGAGWQLRGTASYSESTTESHSRQFVSLPLINAIRAGLFNPYDPAASDPAGRAALFRSESFGLSRQRLSDLRFVVDGELLRLPGGAVKLALGAQYFEEQLRSQKGLAVAGSENSGFPGLSLPANLPGNPSTLIIPSFAPLPVIRRDRSARAAFGELVIPVFGKDNGAPGIEELILSASARYDDYSDFGGTFNPRFGVTYEPLPWVTLRGSWSKSFVAPSLADDADVDVTSFVGVTGPIIVNYSPPPDLVANGTWPAPAAGQTFVALLFGSAPGIRPQKAKTLSLGIDVEPPVVPGLTLGATYWKIDFRELIAPPPIGSRDAMWRRLTSLVTVNPTQAQIDALLAVSDLKLNICQPQPNCFYAVLDGRKRNLGRFKLGGLDFAASYTRATGFGSIDLSVDATYELHRRQRLFAGSPYVDFLAMGVSRLKTRASLGAQIGRLRAQGTLLHTGGYPLETPVGIAPQQTRVGAFDVVNLFFKYDARGDGAFSDLSFTLNIDNVLDQDPPEYRVNSLNTAAGFTNGNTLGRLVQLGASKKF